MQTVSTAWSTLYASDHINDFKAIINGVTYTSAEIWSARVQKNMMESFSIGNAQAAQLDMTFTPSGTIPKGAAVQCYIRLSNGLETIRITDEFDDAILTDDGYYLVSQYPSYSEWIPFGTFYIYSREKEAGGRLSVVAYDAMKKADAAFADGSGGYPKSMSAVVSIIAGQLGVALDSRMSVGSYTIPDPTGTYTIRQVLCNIAAASGGNFIITEAGKLRLIPMASPSDTDAAACSSIQLLSSDKLTISRVTLKIDDDISYTSGNDTGAVLTADCAYATQAMANTLYTALTGKTYLPFSASGVYITPASELGDSVKLEGNLSVLASLVYTISPAMPADVEAPYDGEAEEEYPYVSPDVAALKKKLAEAEAAAKAAQAAADSAQSSANTAQNTANTAESDANTAQSTADSAYSIANTANSTANDASNVVYGFRYAGSSVQINGANLIADTVTASTLQGGEVDLITTANSVAGSIYITGAVSADYKIQFMSAGAMEIDASYGDLYLRSGYGSAFDLGSAFITSNVNFCPSTSGGAYLGLSDRYWAGAYLGSSTITTSDRRKKKDIDYNFEKFDAFFEHLRAATFKFKDGTSGRTHHGMIAQDVEKAMRDCGIDDFAGFVKSPHVCKNGAIGKSYDYALRYEEFIPMLIHRAQQDRQLIDELTKRIDDLEKGVN